MRGAETWAKQSPGKNAARLFLKVEEEKEAREKPLALKRPLQTKFFQIGGWQIPAWEEQPTRDMSGVVARNSVEQALMRGVLQGFF